MIVRLCRRRSCPANGDRTSSPTASRTGIAKTTSSCCSARLRWRSIPASRRSPSRRGATLRYDAAVVATGSRPRPLPGTEIFSTPICCARPGTRTRLPRSARRLQPADRRRRRLHRTSRSAATARRLGLEVTVLEAAPAPLMRVLAPELANWFVELHRAEGVELELAAHAARFGEGPDGAEWVQLTDGRRLDCDASGDRDRDRAGD